MMPILHFGVKFLLFYILSSLGHLVSCKDNPGYYTAAVLEHARFGNLLKDSPDDILKRNLEVYHQAVETASLNNVDIIVFPECGLYPHFNVTRNVVMDFVEDIPDPKLASWNPCEEKERFKKHRVLRYLSCLAQTNNIFIVANVVDVKNCEVLEGFCDAENIEECSISYKNCNSDGVKLFNTNIVLNRNGSLVSRYYKRHLYFEWNMDLPDNPEHAYFETDFGLFTTFTCFDIVFKTSVNSVKERNVKNVAFPTFWFDHFPLTSAIQFHQAWAITNKVNLLSSNIHFPGVGAIGSGIYSSTKGALVYTFNPDGRSKLLISEVPNVENSDSVENLSSKIFHMIDGKFLQVDEEETIHAHDHCTRKVLDEPQNYQKDYRCHEWNITKEAAIKKLDKPTGHLEACSNGLCCTLKYKANSMLEDFYLIVHSFTHLLYETYEFCAESCYLIRCDSYKTEPCSIYPVRVNTTFESVELTGNFSTKYVYPSIIENEMRLTSTKEWKFDNTQINYERQSLNSGKLLSVGLQGRCYDREAVYVT